MNTSRGVNSPILTNEDELLLYGNRRNLAYWFFFVFVVLTIVLIMFLCVNQLNMNFKYTFTEPVVMPKGLTMQRLDEPLWWIQVILVVSRLFFLVISIVRLSKPRDYLLGWGTFHLMFSTLNLVAEITACVLYFSEIRGCNKSPNDEISGRNNLCNDYRWCCVYGTVNPVPNATVINNVEPTCPLLLSPCIPLVVASDLTWNWEFLLALVFGLIMVLVSALHIWVGYSMKDGRNPRYFDIRDDRIGMIPRRSRNSNITIFG